MPWLLLPWLLLWPVVLSRFGQGDVYTPMGLFGVSAIAVALYARKLAPKWTDLRNHWVRNAAIGIAVGVLMTLSTYVAYDVATKLFPSLASDVEGLYRNARSASPAAAIGWTAVVVVAEEMLWRDALVGRATAQFPRRAVVAFSLVTYVAAQCGAGSGVVALAALICGTIWTIERLMTRSVVASLASHMIWTIVVIHIYPVSASP